MEHVTVVFDAPIGSIENLGKLMAQFGREPEGMAARYAGTLDGKLAIVAVWDSKADADRFFTQQLGPALRTVLGTEPAGLPNIQGIDVEDSYVR